MGPRAHVYLIERLERSQDRPDTALAALRAMPQGDMMDDLVAWSDHGDG